MYKLEDKSLLIKNNKIYPINYDLKKEMTNFKDNKKIKGDFIEPPGIKILKFQKKSTIEKLYNIIDNMFKSLNIEIKNSVIAYINEPREGQEYFNPEDDLKEYIKKKKIKSQKIHLFVQLPTMKEGALTIINSLNIKSVEKKFLKSVLVNLVKTYFEKKDYDKIDDVLEKSRLFWLKYTGKHQGHHLHFDSLKRLGPVFIINLGRSFIDYLPFEEITKEEPNYGAFRYTIDKGQIFLMDGDSRRVYLHGVPQNDKKENYLRYAMLLRVPAFYKRKRLCNLTDKYFQNVDIKWTKGFISRKFECYSDTENILK